MVTFFLENFIYYQKDLYLIDHQDLHYNHPYLDIASLIFDARRLYSPQTEDGIIRNYAKKFNLSLIDFRSEIHFGQSSPKSTYFRKLGEFIPIRKNSIS